MYHRRNLLCTFAALFVISMAFTSCAREAAEFPSRPIEIVTQFGAGGGTDLYIRAIAVDGSRLLEQPVHPLSVTGGGGLTSWERFRTQPADGYTLFALGPEQIIHHNQGWIDIFADAEPLMRSQSDIYIYFARADDDRFPNIEAVIAFARANPGMLTIAGTSPNSFDDVQVNLFAMELGIEVNFVPYPSFSEAVAAVLGGHVHILGEEIGPAIGLVEAGNLRPLIAFIDMDEVPHPVLAGVPTSQSMGWSHGLSMGRWRGLAVRRGTPPEVKETLVYAFHSAMQMPFYLDYERTNLLDIRPGFMGPEEFTNFIRNEIELYGRVIDALGW